MAGRIAPDALDRALWFHTSKERSLTSVPWSDGSCDVAIVGGGIMGLSAALTLAEAGVSTVVLEAECIGAGASGRNGGLVVPSLPRIGPSDVLRIMGEQGNALLCMVADSADEVFALIRNHAIECDAVQNGWLNPAHVSIVMPMLEKRVKAWRQYGGRATLLDSREARLRIGSQSFHGALFDPSGGHINPLAYVRGLARAAASAGARIYQDTRVEALERSNGAWHLRTWQGHVRAAIVLQCTNAYPMSAQVSPMQSVDHCFLPITVYQLATTPYGQETRDRILPGDEALTDTRNRLFTVRWTADGRLIRAGMVMTDINAYQRLPARLARRMTRIFPFLGAVRFEYVWRGRAAIVPDFLPRLFEIAPGWFAPIGCNGRGIAMSTALGSRIARFIITGLREHLPIPISIPRPLRFHGLLKFAPRVFLPLAAIRDCYSQWQDRAAIRRSGDPG